MTEDDEGWRKDWALMEGHDELVALKLPNLVGDGLHLEERVAVEAHVIHVNNMLKICQIMNRNMLK